METEKRMRRGRRGIGSGRLGRRFVCFCFCCLFLVLFGVAGGGVRGRVVWDEGDEGERGRGREGTKS